MKKLVGLLLLILLATVLSWASYACPNHPHSQCNWNGQVEHDSSGRTWEIYHCYPCGDTWRVQK